MIRVSILYPNKAGARFDFRYYTESHMPMSIRLLSSHEGFRRVTVTEGFSGASPRVPAPFIAMCCFDFHSVKDFLCAFTPHAEVLRNDLAKYTDIAPIIQFSELLMNIVAKHGLKGGEAEPVSAEST
jgi:uncharacterized protein (TIGR02118 family)